eukprot:3263238-Pleurochrysis_carterae.AAC.1
MDRPAAAAAWAQGAAGAKRARRVRQRARASGGAVTTTPSAAAARTTPSAASSPSAAAAGASAAAACAAPAPAARARCRAGGSQRRRWPSGGWRRFSRRVGRGVRLLRCVGAGRLRRRGVAHGGDEVLDSAKAWLQAVHRGRHGRAAGVDSAVEAGVGVGFAREGDGVHGIGRRHGRGEVLLRLEGRVLRRHGVVVRRHRLGHRVGHRLGGYDGELLRGEAVVGNEGVGAVDGRRGGGARAAVALDVAQAACIAQRHATAPLWCVGRAAIAAAARRRLGVGRLGKRRRIDSRRRRKLTSRVGRGGERLSARTRIRTSERQRCRGAGRGGGG